jgi:hypothetical protein
MTGLRAAAPLAVGGHTLVAVERVWLHVGADGGGWAVGGRVPVAVVVRDAGGTRALDAEGRDADLGALLRDVAGLAAALALPVDAPGPP